MEKISSATIKIELPKDVRFIIDVLMEHGYEAYAVGGCVRDSILGRVPGDWDITTSALPQEVKALFRRTVDTGIQHGTVTIMLGKNGYEITTYRIDGKYEDSRHPENVEFTPKLEEDLKRRDFTINAMAYNDEHGIVDLFNGIEDLKNGVIRCVGNAHDRFTEDALRILRAVRFSAQLGFEIEETTSQAITKLAGTLEKISKERIHTELNKMLKSLHPEYFLMADDLGIMQVIMPEYHTLSREQKLFGGKMASGCVCELPERYASMLLSVHECEDAEGTGIHKDASECAGCHAVHGTASECTECYGVHETASECTECHGVHGTASERTECGIQETAAECHAVHETASEVCRRVLKALKLDNATIDMAALLIKWCSIELTEDESRLRHIMYEVGTQNIVRVLNFRMAYERTLENTEQVERVIRVRELCRRILERGDCLSLKELKITGRDLLELGIPSGKRLGEVLNALLMAVLEDQSLNTVEELTDRARRF